MKSTVLSIIAAIGLLAGLSFPVIVHAQESNAAREMREGGLAAKGALNEADQSLKHVYRAAKDEISDAALTTKVKTALLEDSLTRKFTIHVSSDQGTVALSGAVDSPASAARAQNVAAAVNGVHAVNNRLVWSASAR
jgi:osmotically-inducible protein OsmY